MTGLRHAHNPHRVADAHGRTVDLTPSGPALIHDSFDARLEPQPRGRPRGTAVVRVTAILAGGLVVSVLLVVIRDIVTTVASTSATGLLLKVLLAPSSRRHR
ncbi:hypothetical protein AB0H94_35260 [Streptomyces purpurascens]|uniref:hypothetical protein n=1 Tax=Streptomyces purpurascens TaxID=1924 RepID=UPI0033EE5547